MNYDFYGFPDEMYKVVYPAPGNITLAQELQSSLGSQLPVRPDTEWGFDHGTWVPLTLMYPQADIPVVQLSIQSQLGPEHHAKVGEALAPLSGQGVLIIGSGGVALFALQFAKLAGCRVVAVTSRAEKADRLRALGADLVVSSTDTPEWGAWVREQTGGIDLVVETGGPVTFAQSLIASTLYGHIVLLTLQDAKGRSIEMPAALYQRSLVTISRLFVGSRSNLETMLRAVSQHRLKPVIDKVFPFTEAGDAYRYFQQGDVFGKVVVDGA